MWDLTYRETLIIFKKKSILVFYFFNPYKSPSKTNFNIDKIADCLLVLKIDYNKITKIEKRSFMKIISNLEHKLINRFVSLLKWPIYIQTVGNKNRFFFDLSIVKYRTRLNSIPFLSFFSPCIWTNNINWMRCHYNRLLMTSTAHHILFFIILNLFFFPQIDRVVISPFLMRLKININILYRISQKIQVEIWCQPWFCVCFV